jgi:replicative DNA helicase
MELRSRARQLRARDQLGLVIVDYLQLMDGRSNAETRQVEVAELSRGLKKLAVELQVPIVAVAQVSRGIEHRADKRPALADLKESGAIEADADVVMFLYRDEIYNDNSPDQGIAEVIIAKHRQGPTGTKKLAYLGHLTQFVSLPSP